MKKRKELPHSISAYGVHMLVIIAGVVLFIAAYLGLVSNFSVTYEEQAISLPQTPQLPPLDTADYDTRLLALAHVATSSQWYADFLAGAATTTIGTSTDARVVTPLWPARRAVPPG